MRTHIEHVQRDFTEEEILAFGREAARTTAEIAELEDQKKLAASHFKAAIEKKDLEVAELSTKINLGYEITPTPCDVVLNQPTPGMKAFVCQRSMRTVKTVPMTDEDRQLGLYGG